MAIYEVGVSTAEALAGFDIESWNKRGRAWDAGGDIRGTASIREQEFGCADGEYDEADGDWPA